MALSMFDDDPLGLSPQDPETVRRAAAKKLKNSPANSDSPDDTQYSQLSSTMPGKPGSAVKKPLDPDRKEAIRRRMRSSI